MTAVAVPTLLDAPRCVWEAGARLGEGTCWSVREQSLWWVDILGHRLMRYTPATGARRVWEFETTISAVAERAAAPDLIITLQLGFALFDPATGALQRLQEPEGGRPDNRFNDGKCDAQGRFWAGTMDFACTAPTGALYRYSAAPVVGGAARATGRTTRTTDATDATNPTDAGAASAGAGERQTEVTPESFGTCELALDARFAVTNGPTWSGDGRTMYFTDSVRGEVGAYDFDPDTGGVSNPRLWLRFNANDGSPDGMTTDAAGRIWIARWGAACVSCHEPLSGAELLRIALPTRHITNVAFGGPELDTLYITSARAGLDAAALRAEPLAGGLFAVRTDARGCAPNLFGG